MAVGLIFVLSSALVAESSAQTIKLFLRSNGEIKVDRSCLSLRHLRDKLAVVLEEELDIDGLGVGLVTEKGDEDLETANEGGW